MWCLWIAAAFSILQGLVVFLENQSIATKRFLIFTTACAGWVASNALFVTVSSSARLSVALLSYSFAAALAVSFYFFCRALVYGTVQQHSEQRMMLIGLATILLSGMPGIVGLSTTSDLRIHTNTTTLTLYGLLLLLFFGLGLRALMRAARSGKNKALRAQAQVMLLGLSAAVTIGVTLNLIMPLFGIYSFVVFGPLSSVFLIASSTYAIVRHQMFDIRIAVVRSIAYILSIFIVACIYFSMAYIVSITLFKGNATNTVSVSPVNMILALALALLFQPIKSFFDKITDHIFFRDRYDTSDFYARLSEMLTTSDLRSLLQHAALEIASTLKAEQAFFVLTAGVKGNITVGTSRHQTLPSKDVEYLDSHVKKRGDDVIVAELVVTDHHLHKLLASHKIALLLPLTRHKTIIGYLALGEHRAGNYTSRDVKVLATISDELVIAIQNALSVQEVRDINMHLEQRIEAATAELRTSNDRLKRLDTTKDEFLSMASHQLRTPLTSIKGYLSMMLEGDLGSLNDMQKKVATEAFASSERMVHLIHDFLNVSRLQTGKFALEKVNYDIVTLVQEEVASLERAAELRTLTLKFSTNLKHLTFDFDEMKVRQVVMNFIDNAIFYSPKDSSVEISLKKTGKMVEFIVKDHGIGVPKTEQERLFTKFFRATNARRQRPDGTGVGIFLAKKVIMAHGGEVIFESTEGKGSTFGFRLPVDLPQTTSPKT